MKALVLKKIPFGETDWVVHFLLENGRILSGFAPGGRRSKKRFPHQFPFTAIFDLEWSRTPSKEKLSRIQRCELLEFYPELASDLVNLGRWATILEWVLRDEGGEFEFHDVYSVMRTLEQSSSGPMAYHFFFLEQMKRHGVPPQMEDCLVCGERLAQEEPGIFSIVDGGVAHQSCSDGILLRSSTLDFMRRCLNDRETASEEEFFLEKETYDELDSVSLPYLEYQLGLPLKSRRFYEQVKRGQAPKVPG